MDRHRGRELGKELDVAVWNGNEERYLQIVLILSPCTIHASSIHHLCSIHAPATKDDSFTGKLGERLVGDCSWSVGEIG